MVLGGNEGCDNLGCYHLTFSIDVHAICNNLYAGRWLVPVVLRCIIHVLSNNSSSINVIGLWENNWVKQFAQAILDIFYKFDDNNHEHLSTGSYKNHAMGDKSMFSDLLQILHRSWLSCQKWIFGKNFEIPWMPLPWQPYAIFGPTLLYFHQGITNFCHIALYILA